MKKKLVTIVVLVVLAALAFPISNLIIKPPVSTALTDARRDDPLFAKAAAVFQTKCFHCHAPGAKLPFYASLPIASAIIQEDIADGIEHFNFLVEYLPAEGKPVGEVALAKTEHSIAYGTMPPTRYLALHWNHVVSEDDKKGAIEWTRDVRRKHYATPGYPVDVQNRILQPLPASVAVDQAKAALGNKLYHDKRLSGDDTIACASCHELGKGGTDRQQFSDGIGGAKGDIHSPTTYNAVFGFVQFWDGRAATLEAQADGPVNNPIEMGSNWTQAIGKLEKDAAFMAEFKAAYPDGFSAANCTGAIAEFERTLVTPNARFDKFLAGDANALTDDEKKGHALFLARECATCHVGKNLGGQSFERMGVKRDYFADRGGLKKPDFGRFNVTGKEEDKHKFKVPTLRNIAQTAPYFHDGSTADVRQAVKVMAKYQTDDAFSDAEADCVAKFLASLTGEYQGKLLE